MQTKLIICIAFCLLSCAKDIQIVMNDENNADDTDTEWQEFQIDTMEDVVFAIEDKDTFVGMPEEQVENTSRGALVGTWESRRAGEQYIFNNDGTFTWSGTDWNDHQGINAVKGTWDLEGRSLNVVAYLDTLEDDIARDRSARQFSMAILGDTLYLNVFVRANSQGKDFNGEWYSLRGTEDDEAISNSRIQLQIAEQLCHVIIHNYHSDKIPKATEIHDMVRFRVDENVAFWTT